MSVSTDSQKINELLTRGVEHVYPSHDFLKTQLEKGEKLTLYTGYDPTAPTLHIGNGITLLKLRQFQELGHKVIMLIGDFTGMIGDPTDKSSARQRLTKKEVLLNCKLYQKQADSILDFSGRNKAEIKFNSKWLSKLSFAEVLDLMSHFTVQQMLERDMFQKRFYGETKCENCGWILLPANWKGENVNCPNGCGNNMNMQGREIRETKPIHLHEFLYPLMQGYDSVAMDVDGEVGGNDQTFNMLVGRDLMKDLKNKEKFVLSMKLLADSSGKKMGKTEGNMIAFTDSPEDMFGKVMRWSDEMIVSGFELCTRVPMDEVRQIESSMKAGTNPRDSKLRLAFEITKTFLGEKAAKQGQENFATVIQGHEAPVEIPELHPSAMDIVTVLVEAKFAASRGEARRAIEQGGVHVNDAVVKDVILQVKAGDVVKKGKRFFVRIK